jgi:hypothetical protein
LLLLLFRFDINGRDAVSLLVKSRKPIRSGPYRQVRKDDAPFHYPTISGNLWHRKGQHDFFLKDITGSFKIAILQSIGEIGSAVPPLVAFLSFVHNKQLEAALWCC